MLEAGRRREEALKRVSIVLSNRDSSAFPEFRPTARDFPKILYDFDEEERKSFLLLSVANVARN